MSTDNLDRWNARHAADRSGIGPPTPLLVDAVAGLPPGRALDLACGTGRNAVWLADRGWSVVAVDGSPVAIDRLRQCAPHVDARVADLERHEFEIGASAWDLIVVSCYFQRDLFEPIKRGVAPGGVALVIVHLVARGHEHSRYSARPGELRAWFEDWEVLHAREGAPSDPEHRRAVAEVVARRPAISSQLTAAGAQGIADAPSPGRGACASSVSSRARTSSRSSGLLK